VNSGNCSNGPMESTDWNVVDWRRANTLVRNLRQRIYKPYVVRNMLEPYEMRVSRTVLRGGVYVFSKNETKLPLN